jgi:Xaa-Pro aminopeptidase
MKYPKIDSKLFIENRERLRQQLKKNSILVLNSNDIMPTNADGTMPFKQNNDLFYFTGIEQEETIFLMYPDSPDPRFTEVLFIRNVNSEITTWEGEKLDDKEASEISGIKKIMRVSDFDKIFNHLMGDAEHVYLNANEHKRSASEIETRDNRFIKKCKARYPLHNYLRAAPVIYRLRAIKSGLEIELMGKACELTERGFRRILKFVKPGVAEAEIEAELAHEFIRHNGAFADYQPIVASGINSCALHYIKNNKVCKDGDVVLIDAAASYANYNADMTRTIPVNGKFTPRQKQVYNAVLRAHRETRKLMTKGKLTLELFKDTEAIIEKELVDLRLLKLEDIKNQSPDFHDAGYFHEPLQPGMVLTCEPGIYIREEELGVRIENNILITESGNLDLMESIPVEADEIEEIMNS